MNQDRKGVIEMTAQYLVNIGEVQLYFDAELKRCKPRHDVSEGFAGITHFVSSEHEGGLLMKTWDTGLSEFTEAQRARARLYKKVCE